MKNLQQLPVQAMLRYYKCCERLLRPIFFTTRKSNSTLTERALPDSIPDFEKKKSLVERKDIFAIKASSKFQRVDTSSKRTALGRFYKDL